MAKRKAAAAAAKDDAGASVSRSPSGPQRLCSAKRRARLLFSACEPARPDHRRGRPKHDGDLARPRRRLLRPRCPGVQSPT